MLVHPGSSHPPAKVGGAARTATVWFDIDIKPHCCGSFAFACEWQGLLSPSCCGRRCSLVVRPVRSCQRTAARTPSSLSTGRPTSLTLGSLSKSSSPPPGQSPGPRAALRCLQVFFTRLQLRGAPRRQGLPLAAQLLRDELQRLTILSHLQACRTAPDCSLPRLPVTCPSPSMASNLHGECSAMLNRA